MGVLGVITCEILELEFAHLLVTDRELSRITILSDEWSRRMIETVAHNPGRNLEFITDLNELIPVSSTCFQVIVRVMELGLHNRKRFLQTGVIQAAREMGPHVDAILLGYGLCGNALDQPQELLSEAGVPIFIPMDEDHPVDDCIGLMIGGRGEYYREQCQVAGTFFMIPGWTNHWQRMFGKEFGNTTPDVAKRLFDGYERSLLIKTPIMSEKQMQINSEAFSRMFGFRTVSRHGTLEILYEAWNQAKTFLKKTQE